MIKIFLILIILFNLESLLYSQQWKSVGPPGGRVNVVSIDPQNPNNVFAGTREGFLFKSIDEGLTIC